MLLWELLSYGRTPWGAFGVADIADALRREERLPRPGTSVRASGMLVSRLTRLMERSPNTTQ